jgi:hypothetical protein
MALPLTSKSTGSSARNATCALKISSTRIKNWGAALARLAFDKAKRDAERNHEDFPFQDASDIEREVINPAHWLITEPSLNIRFNIDAFPHVIEAKLPWGPLKTYLLFPLPFAFTAK